MLSFDWYNKVIENKETLKKINAEPPGIKAWFYREFANKCYRLKQYDLAKDFVMKSLGFEPDNYKSKKLYSKIKRYAN